jgi:pseudouridine synthase
MEERLQKVLANAGVASRRKCEEMIAAGRVSVNGRVVTQLGTRVDPDRDEIAVDGEVIRLEKKLYILLHKPRGYISDTDDTADKRPALDLIPFKERLYPAGRLDANSEGLLFLTNDGELAHHLTHPRYEHEKEYLALVVGDPDESVLLRLRKGIWFEGERFRADRVERAARHQRFGVADHGETWLKIVLHEGKKRQIRHMCAAVGHPVLRLIRVRMGPLELGRLRAGEWRAVTTKELTQLHKTLKRR